MAESFVPSDRSTSHFDCKVFTSGRLEPQSREVIEERPVRILVNGTPVATIMRTPGSEEDLAAGFLLTEGIIRSMGDIGAISFCANEPGEMAGEILVHIKEGCPVPERSAYRDVMSSCSLCGDEWMETFAEGITPFDLTEQDAPPFLMLELNDIMAGRQYLFRRTGAVHCAALANVSLKQIVVREDLGRHNALDKAVGASLHTDIDLKDSLLMLSSRLSLEMVAKAARSGIGRVAGVSAPSAAAIRLAHRLNMFLAGFVRDQKMTVYSVPGESGRTA